MMSEGILIRHDRMHGDISDGYENIRLAPAHETKDKPIEGLLLLIGRRIRHMCGAVLG